MGRAVGQFGAEHDSEEFRPANRKGNVGDPAGLKPLNGAGSGAAGAA